MGRDDTDTTLLTHHHHHHVVDLSRRKLWRKRKRKEEEERRKEEDKEDNKKKVLLRGCARSNRRRVRHLGRVQRASARVSWRVAQGISRNILYSPSFTPFFVWCFGRAARFCVVLPRMRRVANEPSVLTTPKRFFFRSFSIRL